MARNQRGSVGPFGPAIEGARTAAGAFQPDNARAVMAWYDGLGAYAEAQGELLRVHANKLDNFPLHPAARDQAMALARMFSQLQGAASDAASTFRKAHADDINRIENPRQNEHMWDFSRNKS